MRGNVFLATLALGVCFASPLLATQRRFPVGKLEAAAKAVQDACFVKRNEICIPFPSERKLYLGDKVKTGNAAISVTLLPGIGLVNTKYAADTGYQSVVQTESQGKPFEGTLWSEFKKWFSKSQPKGVSAVSRLSGSRDALPPGDATLLLDAPVTFDVSSYTAPVTLTVYDEDGKRVIEERLAKIHSVDFRSFGTRPGSVAYWSLTAGAGQTLKSGKFTFVDEPLSAAIRNEWALIDAGPGSSGEKKAGKAAVLEFLSETAEGIDLRWLASHL